MKKTLLLTLCCILSIAAPAQDKFVGGDISLLTKYEEAGVVYKDKNGNTVHPLAFFKQEGLNAMRVRLFVDPSKASEEDKKEGVVQDLEYVKALGKRIKDAGFKLMLDFHYSDTWTDPGQHSTPSAWSTLDAEGIADKVYEYTKDCLQQLNTSGATPDFIQVGNEINVGMLWPTGAVHESGGAPAGGSWNNFASYLSNGIKACNEECPNAQIIIHAALNEPNNLPAFYNKLDGYTGVKYQIIGLSYYPAYHKNIQALENVIMNLETQEPDKDIMIVETGYSYAWALPKTTYNYTSTYPYTEEGQRNFTADLITMLNKYECVKGLFWWWPEDNGNKNVTTSWWNAALYNHNTGQPYAALYELKNFLGDPSGIETINREPLTVSQHAWYTLDGRKLNGAPNQRGIYIHNGKKMVVR